MTLPPIHSTDSILLLAIVCLVFAWIGVTENRCKVCHLGERITELQGQNIRILRQSAELRTKLPVPESVKRAAIGKLAYEFSDCQHCRRAIHRRDDGQWTHADGNAECPTSKNGPWTFATPVVIPW